tara:strand:+ start:925 stop:1689 length:765 start_codon:yes stop_codon:yes gene_type:complete
MKKTIIIVLLLITHNSSFSRNIGETEITTEEGIEVFQNEKYYLLKKNVKIESDSFNLTGDLIKIFFEKDLYDIKIIDAVGNVKMVSDSYKLKASGENLEFIVDNEEISIKGLNSKLITEDTDMYSDGTIIVNNLTGDFLIEGQNSSLLAEDIFIEGEYIEGNFSTNNENKEINLLNVLDEKIAYIKTDDTEMYSNIINYDKKTSLIELENNVKIIRGGETITGDYGTLDTATNSYKVKSKESKKVKVIILNQDE